MPTLGEMVALHALKHRKFDIYHAQLALESLGIWDAEVLECECKKDDFECEAFYPVTRNWRDLGLEYGDRVRVIVLKEE